MNKSVFPVRFWCVDNRGWAQCPELAKMVWLRIKNGLIWYATDMEILSPNSIKLFVYDMADPFHGGIGKVIYKTTITEFTDKERELLNQIVEGIYTDAADAEVTRREDAERQKKVLEIRKEMFGI